MVCGRIKNGYKRLQRPWVMTRQLITKLTEFSNENYTLQTELEHISGFKPQASMKSPGSFIRWLIDV